MQSPEELAKDPKRLFEEAAWPAECPKSTKRLAHSRGFTCFFVFVHFTGHQEKHCNHLESAGMLKMM